MQHSGALILDKPQGFTSFDAVAVMRRLLNERKIGHTGTLDPMATGVLVILVGRATKAASFLENNGKTYEAGFRFGAETDTQDSTGAVLRTDDNAVSREALEAVLPKFRGEIWQMPPMYSAVSVNGQRLYTLARQGVTVAREKRPVTIDWLEVCTYDPEKREGILRVSCSKGTYIRTLCADIGEALGTYGMMTALRRVEACGFSLSSALTLDDARALSESGCLAERILPTASLFSMNRDVSVSAAQATRFRNGGALDLQRIPALRTRWAPGERIRVYAPDGEFLGLGECGAEPPQLRVLKLF